jgi:hypothetical protein
MFHIKEVIMKTFLIYALLFCCAQVVCNAQSQVKTDALVGAWETQSGQDKIVGICSEKFFSAAVYRDKNFIGTYGGSYSVANNAFVGKFEFHTIQPELVGTDFQLSVQLNGNNLTLEQPNGSQAWKRLDNGKPGKLAGAWLITGRMQNGSMGTMTPGARRTMKILSGTRFQWIAYNVDTKEFFGAGGGSYTTENGKYTEHIEFFSRDSTRVGQSLEFDFALEKGKWRHKGKSSRSEPIDEIWTKREELGL